MKKMKLKGLKRGYEVTMKTKLYNFGEGRHRYEVYELAGPKMDKPRTFVDTESVLKFVNELENEVKIEKTFLTAVKRVSSKSERKELQAAKELSEMPVNGKAVLDVAYSTYYNGGHLNIETTKANAEDTDK